MEMARAVVEGIPVGRFNSADCQEIIRRRWRRHPPASAGGTALAAQFKTASGRSCRAGEVRNSGQETPSAAR